MSLNHYQLKFDEIIILNGRPKIAPHLQLNGRKTLSINRPINPFREEIEVGRKDEKLSTRTLRHMRRNAPFSTDIRVRLLASGTFVWVNYVKTRAKLPGCLIGLTSKARQLDLLTKLGGMSPPKPVLSHSPSMFQCQGSTLAFFPFHTIYQTQSRSAILELEKLFNDSWLNVFLCRTCAKTHCLGYKGKKSIIARVERRTKRNKNDEEHEN